MCGGDRILERASVKLGPASDLARFASWQFRLLGNARTEVLAANTLREMHRVHFTDPDGQTTRGLGFRVWRSGSATMVGHSGDCPGFRTALQLQPESKIATIFMANASGIPAETLADRMYEIVAPALRAAIAGASTRSEASTSPYQGSYDWAPWGGEMIVFPWEDGLALLELPSRDPMGDLMRLAAVPGREGQFRRVREDGLGEPITFDVGSYGRAVRLWRWNNPFPKKDRRSPQP